MDTLVIDWLLVIDCLVLIFARSQLTIKVSLVLVIMFFILCKKNKKTIKVVSAGGNESINDFLNCVGNQRFKYRRDATKKVTAEFDDSLVGSDNQSVWPFLDTSACCVAPPTVGPWASPTCCVFWVRARLRIHDYSQNLFLRISFVFRGSFCLVCTKVVIVNEN